MALARVQSGDREKELDWRDIEELASWLWGQRRESVKDDTPYGLGSVLTGSSWTGQFSPTNFSRATMCQALCKEPVVPNSIIQEAAWYVLRSNHRQGAPSTRGEMGTESAEVSRGYIIETLSGQAKEVRCFLRALGFMGEFAARK